MWIYELTYHYDIVHDTDLALAKAYEPQDYFKDACRQLRRESQSVRKRACDRYWRTQYFVIHGVNHSRGSDGKRRKMLELANRLRSKPIKHLVFLTDSSNRSLRIARLEISLDDTKALLVAHSLIMKASGRTVVSGDTRNRAALWKAGLEALAQQSGLNYESVTHAGCLNVHTVCKAVFDELGYGFGYW